MAGSSVRVGLLLHDFSVPAWAMSVLTELQASDNAQLGIVVIPADLAGPQTRRGVKARLGGSASALPRLIYRRVVEKTPRLPDALALQNATDLIADVPVVRLSGATIDPDTLNDIRGYDLDVFVNLGFGPPGDPLHAAARCGVWALNDSEYRAPAYHATGFCESVESRPVTRTRLRLMAERAVDERIIDESFSSTDALSVADNQNRCYWKSRVFITRAVERLHRLGAAEFLAEIEAFNRRPVFDCTPPAAAPTSLALFKIIVQKSIARLRRKWAKRRFFEQWALLYRFSDHFAASLADYHRVVPPRDRFWADPHVLARGDRYYVFVEEYQYAGIKGDIAVLTFTQHGFTGQHETILSQPYHLSYPFVFEHAGEYFMIPETKANRTIELYKCTDFPTGWAFERYLMTDIQAVDTTVIHHHGKWWLFATIGSDYKTSTWDELFVFYADDLTTAHWRAHPQNPIVSDCRRARPGGRVFVDNGRLYRVSQNCARRYGYGFNMHEILSMDTRYYAERLIGSVTPDWNQRLLATHTFNRVGALHIADGLYQRRR